MLRLAKKYLRYRGRVIGGSGARVRAGESEHASAESGAPAREKIPAEKKSASCSPAEAQKLWRFLRSLRWYPHLTSFYRTPVRDFERALAKLELPQRRREELFREFKIREVGMWIEIPVAQWERLKSLASSVSRSDKEAELPGSAASGVTREEPARVSNGLPERSAENGGETSRTSADAPLLTRENLRRCLRCVAQLQEEFGDASLQEVAEALELSRAKALALLEVLKREGKAYEAKPGRWRAVVLLL